MEENIYQVKRTTVSKIEDNKTYQDNWQKPVNDVSYNDMSLLLKLFLDKAAINVGRECYDAPEVTKESILEFVCKEFRFIPVYYIGSAIIKGSLDSQSTNRLTPRLVHKWLIDATIEYRRYKDHLDREEQFKEKPITFDLHKYPVGSAIAKKIEWYKKGFLSIDDWDLVPLKDVAEAIARGEYVTIEKFLK